MTTRSARPGAGRRPSHAFTVAVVGPDGAGKTTVAELLMRRLPWPSVRMYMSINPASGNYLLPTTWLAWVIRGRPAHLQEVRRPGRTRVARVARTAAELLNQVAEERYRLAVARWHLFRGRMVLFDRHYYLDYYATEIATRPVRWEDRLHGRALRHYPLPDLTVYLDASPELLLHRKGEGTLESLAALRRELAAAVGSTPCHLVVDAAAPLETVVDQVLAAVQDHELRRRQAARNPAADRSPLAGALPQG